MKSKMGDEITNDIFAMKIEQNYGEITKKLDELSTTDKLFKKAYIGQMDYGDYANLREELSDVYGGATARMAEKA